MENTMIEVVEDQLQMRTQLLQHLKEMLLQVQNKMKQKADVKQLEREFTVGDWVLVKLQPYK